VYEAFGLDALSRYRYLLMKAETRPEDGVIYWAYILICVDDLICVHHDPGTPLTKLDEYFKMKEGFIQVPTFDLSASLKKVFCQMALLLGA
jgi:hypothetical protein